mgnify:FL=1
MSIRYVSGGAVLMTEAELEAKVEPISVKDRTCFTCPHPSDCKVFHAETCGYLNGTDRKPTEPTGIEIDARVNRNAYQREYYKRNKKRILTAEAKGRAKKKRAENENSP